MPSDHAESRGLLVGRTWLGEPSRLALQLGVELVELAIAGWLGWWLLVDRTAPRSLLEVLVELCC